MRIKGGAGAPESSASGRPRGLASKRRRKGREEETLARLQKFKSGLQSSDKKARKGRGGGEEEEDAAAERREAVPAAWRVDDYLGSDGEDDDFGDLRSHVLTFKEGAKGGAMARRDDVDDYVVHDPLLDRSKAGRGGRGGRGRRDKGKARRR